MLDLSTMTCEEWQIVSALLASLSVRDASNITGFTQAEVRKVWDRWQFAVRCHLQTTTGHDPKEPTEYRL